MKIFKLIGRLTDTRRGMALFDVLLSIFLTILLGGVLSLLRGNFIESWRGTPLQMGGFGILWRKILKVKGGDNCV